MSLLKCYTFPTRTTPLVDLPILPERQLGWQNAMASGKGSRVGYEAMRLSLWLESHCRAPNSLIRNAGAVEIEWAKGQLLDLANQPPP